MTRPLADAPNMEQIKKQAKDLLKGHQAQDADAIGRIHQFHPQLSKLSQSDIPAGGFTLADAQLTVAREHGFASWPRLKKHVDSLTLAGRLKAAITADDVSLVMQMVQKNPELLRAPVGYGGSGPLTWAAECRQAPPSAARLEIARRLIEAGADIHEGGDAPLMRAALRDDRIPMMELLVVHGADINAQWNGFYSIILASCEALAPRALRWLLDRGADPNAISRGQPDYGTALDMAIATYDRSPRQSECVNALIEAGGTSKYSHLPTVLIHRRRVDLLIEALDEDPDLVHRRFPELDYGATGLTGLSLRGTTLVHVAAEYGEVDALRALLERGADVNARAAIDEHGVGGQTPLFHAATQFRDFGLEAVRFLIAAGADLTVRAVVPSGYDKPGETLDVTALGYAVRFPHGEWECHGTAALLKDAGAPAGDIYAAAKLGMNEELRQLLESGADPNTAHPHGETALAAATRNGHTPAVLLLRDAGARE